MGIEYRQGKLFGITNIIHRVSGIIIFITWIRVGCLEASQETNMNRITLHETEHPIIISILHK